MEKTQLLGEIFKREEVKKRDWLDDWSVFWSVRRLMNVKKLKRKGKILMKIPKVK